ncbi:hypothetical protein J0K78_12290 [Halobacillus sp. GSS1]|uniref:hypothetical protein n=1 Tax=Halobacillus sp. GSS1 TaxID=2815919 RepID=UPI001A8C53B3|nr:hypothetical protein [Halobacillus sp. GSS1]MBN9655050.1 hypothetical protein [Halobacillus sp. GSS1]
MKMKFELLINIIFSIIKALCMLWVISKSSGIFTYSFLGIFLLSRRFSSTISNFLQLGMAQTIRRYVSMNLENNSRKDYVFFGFLIWIIISICTLPIVLFYDDALAELMFGEKQYESLGLLTWMVTLSLILHYLANSTLFSERKVFLSNIFDLMNSSGFVLIALYIEKLNNSPETVLHFQVIGIISICFIYLLSYFSTDFSLTLFIKNKQFSRLFNTFVKYGSYRGLITFFDSLVILIGPWLLRDNLVASGNLVIAYTFLRLIQTAINPISQIISVGVARNLNNKDIDSHISKAVRNIVGIVIYLSVIALCFLIPWRDEILYLWLRDYSIVNGVSFYYNAILLALVPISIFHGLKGIIEMKWFKPYNLYTLIVTIIIQVLSFLILTNFVGDIAINLSIIISFFIAGLMTLFYLKDYLPKVKYYSLGKLLLASSILLLVNYTLLILNINIMISFVVYFVSIIIVFKFFSSLFITEIYTMLKIDKNIKNILKKSFKLN